MFLPILGFAHDLVSRAVSDGDLAVDATVGNGHDTLWLARCVGPSGTVVGIDLQAGALRTARRRLIESGVSERVVLVQADHRRLGEMLATDGRAEARPRAVMFNLGYLPGGDRSIITRPETTVPALEAMLDRLAPGGVMTVVLYPGHPGGAEECEAVLSWARSRTDHRRAEVLRYERLHPNPKSPAPWLLALSPP